MAAQYLTTNGTIMDNSDYNEIYLDLCANWWNLESDVRDEIQVACFGPQKRSFEGISAERALEVRTASNANKRSDAKKGRAIDAKRSPVREKTVSDFETLGKKPQA